MRLFEYFITTAAMSAQAKVLDIQKHLEKMTSSGADQGPAMSMLKILEDIPMDLDILSNTRIGMTVNLLRKAAKDKELVIMAKALIKKWKKYLPEGGEGRVSPTNPVPTSTTISEEVKRSQDDSDGESAPKKPRRESTTEVALKPRRESTTEVAIKPTPKPSSPPFKNSAKTITSFPPVSTTDAVRLKCRELLENAIKGDGNLPEATNDPEFLSEQLEEQIFKEFNNTEIKYKNRVRSRVANLRDAKNPNLRLNFLVGDISPMRLARMTAEEMASDELKATRTKFVQEAINDAQLAVNPGTKTDLLKCGKCGKRDCTYNQLQTRSADEPMTTFVFCNICSHRWGYMILLNTFTKYIMHILVFINCFKFCTDGNFAKPLHRSRTPVHRSHQYLYRIYKMDGYFLCKNTPGRMEEMGIQTRSHAIEIPIYD